MHLGSDRADSAGWSTVARETVYADAHLQVTVAQVRTPQSQHARSWTVVHRNRAVVIAPLTADGRLVLLRQERIAVRATLWEVPAGQIDAVGEDERTVALRELREETGYELSPGGELVELGAFYSSPGFTDERASLFLARGVQPSATGHSHQASESILDCRPFSPREVSAMIRRDEIQDANTLSICAKLLTRGFLSLPL
ncbi:MAG: NUDIX hydrolase [Chthoniobacterales bacterium]